MRRPFIIIAAVLAIIAAAIVAALVGRIAGRPAAEHAQWAACRMVDGQGRPRLLDRAVEVAAVEACTAIIEAGRQTRQGFVDAYLHRGNAYRYAAAFDRAIADFGEAARLDPRNPLPLVRRAGVYRFKGWFAMETEYDKHAADRPKPASSRAFIGAGRESFGRALADYNRAIRLKSDDAAVYLQRADVRYLVGETDGALADCDEAIRLDSANPRTFMARAGLNDLRGNHERAIADYDAAARLKPGWYLPFFGRGLAHAAMGQYERAVEDYDHAIRLWPEDDTVLTERCRARLILGRLADALTDCDAALKDPSRGISLDALGSRGLVHLRMGNPEMALADFNQLIKRQPDDAEALYGRGLAKRMKGDAAGATADLAAAEKIDPGIAAKIAKYGLPAP